MVLHFLHCFLGIHRVGGHAAEDVIAHGDSCFESLLLAIVQFIGKILRNHHAFAADADSPTKEGCFFQRVSRDVLYAAGHELNRLGDLYLKAALF